MFGHLKAADFMNVVEGAPLLDKRAAHLRSCARCTQTLNSIKDVRNQMAMQRTADEHIPEPDWADFRGDVRNALLSRSVKRETAGRSWLGGMDWKPAAALGFSIVLVFAVIGGAVMWKQAAISDTAEQVTSASEIAEASGIDAVAGMAQTDVFDDLLRLNETETENLKRMVESLTRKAESPQ
jgi:hypothetical protein